MVPIDKSLNQVLSHYFFLGAVCLQNWKLFSISYRLQKHTTYWTLSKTPSIRSFTSSLAQNQYSVSGEEKSTSDNFTKQSDPWGSCTSLQLFALSLRKPGNCRVVYTSRWLHKLCSTLCAHGHEAAQCLGLCSTHQPGWEEPSHNVGART